MALKLFNTERQTGDFDCGKPKFPDLTDDSFWSDLEVGQELQGLAKLVGPSTWSLPNMLEMSAEDMSWLNSEVENWEFHGGYVAIRDFLKDLRVVNDTAERGVKMISDFVDSTNNETLRQDLMVAISDQRKKKPLKNLSKKML